MAYKFNANALRDIVLESAGKAADVHFRLVRRGQDLSLSSAHNYVKGADGPTPSHPKATILLLMISEFAKDPELKAAADLILETFFEEEDADD